MEQLRANTWMHGIKSVSYLHMLNVLPWDNEKCALEQESCAYLFISIATTSTTSCHINMYPGFI